MTAGTIQLNAVSGAIMQSAWKITSFTCHGNDQTPHFTNYQFDFNSNNTVVATKPWSSVNGSWHTAADNNVPKLYMDFGSVSHFEDLNEDWQIKQNSDTRVYMEHSSGGGGTDYLTIEKI